MTENGRLEPAVVVRVVVGALLVAAGVVLWVVTDRTAWGLLSGAGVVLVYTGLSPEIERRRTR